MAQLNVKFSYPRNDEYEYKTRLERINLDEERKNDIRHDRGFVVAESYNIKKDLKNPNGIFSTRYGQTLQDINPFADRYKCECGNLKSRINHGVVCPLCGTKVKYVDDNFQYFGWICLQDPYYIIHPNLFKSIEFFIGSKRFDNIINIMDEKDQDGYSMKTTKPKDEPFYGIGMIEFKNKFREIMDYYLAKFPAKAEYYNDILDNKDLVFTQSIPVYTTQLRPFRVEGDEFRFEGVNATYTMITRLVARVNKNKLKMDRELKPKNQLLYNLQIKVNKLYKEIENIISGKKGSVRSFN